MLCEICHLREATIRFTQVVNLEKKEIIICTECAEKKGLSNPMAGLQKFLGGFVSTGYLSDVSENEQNKEPEGTICATCRTSWNDFKNEGLFGCGNCYRSFEKNLKILLKKIHGSSKHIGNRPARLREISSDLDLDDLKARLKKAIEQENYEQAARLRDRIKDIEANLNRLM